MATSLEANLRITSDTTQAVAGVKALGKEAGTLKGGLAPAGKALDDLGAKTEANTKRVQDATRRLALLRPQLTDIITGLATGQSPFTILLQQGGQLGDVFGGFGNALKALGSIFTVTRVLAGGAAVGIGAVAFAAFQGAQESDALRKSIALTGNAAAISAGQFDRQAQAIAAASKATIGDAREVLAEVVASGQFTGAALATVGVAVATLGRLNGQSAADNLKLFTALADGVSAKSAKLNQQFNFLTVEQFKLIQQMEAQGRVQEAVRLVMEAFNETLQSRLNPSMGFFARLWRDISKEASEALEIFKSLGRDKTVEDAIDAAQAKVDKLRRSKGDGPGTPRLNADLSAAEQELQNQQRTQAAERVGNAQRAAALRESQDEIKKLEKGYQDSRSAITAAGIQKRLAGELAAIEQRRSAVEQDHAAGLISEREFAARSSAIDIERLQAQRSALQATLASERAKLIKGGETQEQNAQQARVLQLEAQLTEMGTRIQAATAKAGADVSAAQLAEARTSAQAYAEVWQRAAQQAASFAQSAAETSARLLADPARRAQAEADAATAALRAQQAQTERDLGNQIALSNDPNQAAALQAQLDDLRAKAKVAIEEADRAAQFSSLVAQAAEARARLASDTQAVRQQIDAGQITEAEGERQMLDLRRAQIPDLERILALLKERAKTAADKQAVADTKNEVDAWKDLRLEMEKTARSQAVGGLASAISDIATRAKTGKEALLDMVASFAKAMLDVLSRKLAEQLVNQFIDAAGKTGGGGLGALISSGASFLASLFHSGGIVGAGGGASRQVSPLAFALAPRYHGGGIAGLLPDEVPAVLRKGEEVLRADDPRHRSKGGGAVSIAMGDVHVSAGGGDEGSMQEAGQGLQRAIKVAIVDYVTDQHRPGGVFARR